MSRLRLCSYREFSKVAERVGFRWVRCAGSHNSFRHADGRVVVIPDHGADPIVRPLARQLIRDLGLSVDQYNDILAEI